MDFPHAVSWRISKLPITKKNLSLIQSHSQIHAGERCFILANGPSLLKMDLSLLKHEITFGMNRIYLLETEIGFSPTYFVAINGLVLTQFQRDIAHLPMKKFLNWNYRNLYPAQDQNTVFIKPRFGFADSFNGNIKLPIHSGGTVTFVTLQIAYYLGFNEVVIIGLDHNYTNRGIPNKTEVRNSVVDTDHFHPNYFPKGVKWQLPDLYRSEIAYTLARSAFEKDGRKIYDATINGKCDVFPKIDFNLLFEKSL